VDSLAHADDILIDTCSTSRDHALNTLVLSKLFDYKRCLHGKLSDGHQDKSLDFVQTRVDSLDQGNAVSCSLSRAVLSLSDDVFAAHDLGNSLLLDGRRQLESHFKNAKLH